MTDKQKTAWQKEEERTEEDVLDVTVTLTATLLALFFSLDRLVGLVVKASASTAEGPGFESRLRRDFFGVESYQ